MGRMIFVDFFRAVAILLVTLFHIWKIYGKPVYNFHGMNLLGFLRNGDAGVELFFFISGFCMVNSLLKLKTHTLKDYGDYLLNRILRIAPAYYFAIIFWNIIISLNLYNSSNSIKDNLMHIFFLHTLTPKTFFTISGVFWSLAVEMHFYILLPFVLPFMIKKPRTILFISFCISIIINQYWGEFFTSKFRYIVTCNIFSFLFLFLSGAYCFMKFSTISKFITNKYICLIITSITAFLLFNDRTLFSGFKTHQIMTGFSLGITMIAWSSLLEKVNDLLLKPFLMIGVSSYSIYLYNYVYHIWRFRIHGITGFFLNFFMVIAFGFLMYKIIEFPIEKRRKTIVNYIKQKKLFCKKDLIVH